MSFGTEIIKLKRTGFFPAFLGGAVLCAAVPIVNMAVRGDNYTSLPGSPLQILLNANWSLMATFAMVFIVAGACILYHTEYEHGAMQKMQTMPGNMFAMFLKKCTVLFGVNLLILLFETASIAFCTVHWFDAPPDFAVSLLANFGYCALLAVPGMLLMMLVAAGFKNMWVSLGIGVVLVFTATMFAQFSGSFIVAIFPFSMPYSYCTGMETKEIIKLCAAAVAETLLFTAAGYAMIKIRRAAE